MPAIGSRSMLFRFIALTIILCSAISVYSQNRTLPDEVVLTYVTNNKPLKQVLKELDKKSGVTINFRENRIPGNRKVTINAVKQPLGIILKAILKDKRCQYDIIGNQIVISRVNTRDKYRNLTISGYVKDRTSGESLVGANIYLFDKTKGTQSNEYGFYSITLNKGTKRLYYSYLGYSQEVKEIFLQRDTVINIDLDPDALLNQIIILDDVENQEEPNTASESKLHLGRINSANSLAGEGDIMRLIALMPGVDSGADGLGGMNVRGGSADQNLVLLDGVPIYNVGHALGLFSIFNSNVIKNANLIKGNIPARYGGRLSSILDVRTREGNNKEFAGEASLSLLASKISLEGPLGSNGSSYIVALRRTFLDGVLRNFTEWVNNNAGDEGFSSYNFMDLNAKLSLKLDEKNSLYLNAYYGNDNFGTQKSKSNFNPITELTNITDTGTDWDWGNRIFSAKLTSQFSTKAFGRLTGYLTQYSFDSFEFDDFNSLINQNPVSRSYKAGYYKSAITDISLKYDFDYIPNTNHLLRSGVGITHHSFSPGLVAINSKDQVFEESEPITVDPIKIRINEPQLNGLEYFAYLEDDISLGYGTKINVGIHTNITQTGETTYYSIQPRVSFLARWEGAFFKAGVSRMNQYLHLLSSNGLGLPTDVWLPSTENLAPEKSWIATAGVGYYNSRGVRAGVEAYYKIFDALTTFDEGGVVDISEGNPWENAIPIGTGTAYGIEAYFNKIIGRSTWNSNYTLAFSEREFEGLSIDNEPFSFRYNRRHNVKLGFLHKITDNTEFSLNWNLSSGNPITKPDGQVISINGEIQAIYTCKNCGLLPTYNRVDLGFNFYNRYAWGRSKLSLGVYNVFNKKNPFYSDIEISDDNPNRFQTIEYSILPVVPTLGYSVSF